LPLFPAGLEARPGGGQGFSGGGGDSGGGGGGDLGLIYLLIRLCFEYPQIGVPALIVFVIWVNVNKKAGGQTSWEVGTTAVRVPMVARTVDLDALRARDPEFSRVLFEDFVYALYAEAHKSRHDPEALKRLAPYIEGTVRDLLAKRPPVGVPVQAAIVGALRVINVRVPQPTPGARGVGNVQVALKLETNLVLSEGAQYVNESWTLVRSAAAVTRPWKGLRTFGCPSCGAPFESRASRCASCGKDVDNGRFDWTVHRAIAMDVQTVPPVLTGTVEERGTDRPTVARAGVRDRWEALLRDDPGLTHESLSARLMLVFTELNAGWAAQDLKRIRPFVSESMHEYLRYWIEAYKAQGLVNKVEGARVVRWVPVRVERDRHYDALTIRLWGTGRDATVEAASGRVVGGDPNRDRRYSEYWTLIRGAEVRGQPRSDKACPSCGGPLEVTMSGNCEYCNALVTTGEFDWVLSRIEQDDVYAG
jgi:hypothetical protein